MLIPEAARTLGRRIRDAAEILDQCNVLCPVFPARFSKIDKLWLSGFYRNCRMRGREGRVLDSDSAELWIGHSKPASAFPPAGSTGLLTANIAFHV